MSLFFVVQTICMQNDQVPAHKIIIIDRNKDQSIPITPDNLVGVFGATPRYSAFTKYISTLQSHCRQLSDCGKKLKGLPKKTKQFLTEITELPGLEAVNQSVNPSSQQEKMQLFFTAGLDTATLQQNMLNLVQTTDRELKDLATLAKSNGNPVLAHIFVPSYFIESSHLVCEQQELYLFLQQSAEFYKDMYQRAIPVLNFPVYIIIPKVIDFIAAMSVDNPNKLELNLNLVKKELMSSQCEGYMLIDQNIQDLNDMVTYLQKNGIAKIAGRYLSITNSLQQNITIFNPYLIRPEKTIPLFKESPVFNAALKAFIQQAGKHE